MRFVSDEELKAALREILSGNHGLSPMDIREILHEKHRDWDLSDTRIECFEEQFQKEEAEREEEELRQLRQRASDLTGKMANIMVATENTLKMLCLNARKKSAVIEQNIGPRNPYL